jgi:adenylate kinase
MGRQGRRMTVVVLLGAPGAGKGTQAEILAEQLGIPHVSTGDLFRTAVRDGSPIGLEARRYMERGQLVPDDITIRMLLDRLTAPDAADGVILDGFPRNRPQAEALASALAERGSAVDRALTIDVPTDELVRRLSGRWVCRDSGHVYNESTNPPKVPGRCDLDGSPLIQREDDKPETIRARLTQQLASLGEVVDHYDQAGLLRVVNGVQPIDQVTADLVAAIDASASNGVRGAG